jgi:hypothetical protein
LIRCQDDHSDQDQAKGKGKEVLSREQPSEHRRTSLSSGLWQAGSPNPPIFIWWTAGAVRGIDDSAGALPAKSSAA